MGTTLFDVAEGEHIVSVAKLGDTGEDEDENGEVSEEAIVGIEGADITEGEGAAEGEENKNDGEGASQVKDVANESGDDAESSDDEPD